MSTTSFNTEEQFKQVMAECRSLFEKKLHDYSASWRILRPSSLTDQLFIKAKRIRSLEIKKESLVGEGIRPEFIGLINYGIVGLIQLVQKGCGLVLVAGNDIPCRFLCLWAIDDDGCMGNGTYLDGAKSYRLAIRQPFN